MSPDRRLVTAPNGVTIAPADDGVIRVSGARERALAAIAPNTTAERLGLMIDSAAAVTLRGASLQALLASLERRAPDIGRIGHIERVTGELELGDRLHGRLVERLAPGTD